MRPRPHTLAGPPTTGASRRSMPLTTRSPRARRLRSRRGACPGPRRLGFGLGSHDQRVVDGAAQRRLGADRVRRPLSRRGDHGVDELSPAQVGSVNLGDLPANQKYEMQVAAQNAVGVGPFSALVSATTPTVPAVPTSLRLAPRPAASRRPGRLRTAAAHRSRATSFASRAPRRRSLRRRQVPSGLAGTPRPYTVEVAAQNAVGTGPYASATGTTSSPAQDPTPVVVLPERRRRGDGLSAYARPPEATSSALGDPDGHAEAQHGGRDREQAGVDRVLPERRRCMEQDGVRLHDFRGRVLRIGATGQEHPVPRRVRGAGRISPACLRRVDRVRPKISLKGGAQEGEARLDRLGVGTVLPKVAGKAVTLQCLKGRKWSTKKSGRRPPPAPSACVSN